MHREPTATDASDPGRLVDDVLEAVAGARGCHVAELDARLYDVIDPDCLDRLFRTRADGTPRAGGRVVFSMADCEVTVRNDRSVTATLSGAGARSDPVTATGSE